jgi:hypothetical protein
VLSSITGYGTIDFGKSSDECDLLDILSNFGIVFAALLNTDYWLLEIVNNL